MSHTVAIFLYDDVEVLDFAGPFEVFTTAARVMGRLQPEATPLFRVLTVAETLQPVRARGGLVVQPAVDFTQCPAIDLLIIPGGIVDAQLERKAVLQWIWQTAQKSAVTASVCTGAFLLARIGLLSGREATTHWEDIPDLRSMFPQVRVQEGRRWIDEGSVVTAAGISAGIDMSLHLVARLAGLDLARRTARQMEYDWSLATEEETAGSG